MFRAAARDVRGGALDANRDRRLVLARDRMGIKPLYIARRGEDLYFGSELKAILVHPEIERWLSLDGLDCYLSLNYVPAPWTLVEGIEKLLPGQWLEWRRGAIRTRPLLAACRTGRATSAGRPKTAEAELDRLLKQSVREHLRVRRAVGRLAQRRPGFVHPRALRRRGIQLASEDVFHHLSRPQL